MVDSRMLDILRQIGAAEPARIKLAKLLQSPAQDYFSFDFPKGREEVLVKILVRLGQVGVNIRFINKYLGNNGEVRVQICLDAEHHHKAECVLQSQEVVQVLQRFHHQMNVRIFSLYPFGGHPKVAERLISTLRLQKIPVLAVNNASSVLSCVVPGSDSELALTFLKRAFVF